MSNEADLNVCSDCCKGQAFSSIKDTWLKGCMKEGAIGSENPLLASVGEAASIRGMQSSTNKEAELDHEQPAQMHNCAKIRAEEMSRNPASDGQVGSRNGEEPKAQGLSATTIQPLHSTSAPSLTSSTAHMDTARHPGLGLHQQCDSSRAESTQTSVVYPRDEPEEEYKSRHGSGFTSNSGNSDLESGSSDDSDEEMIKHHELPQPGVRIFQAAAAMICLVMIMLGVNLGLYRRKKDAADQVSPTSPSTAQAPSQAPSATPTMEALASLPTDSSHYPSAELMARAYQFQASLPNYSQQALLDPRSPERSAMNWLVFHPLFQTAELEDWRTEQLFALATVYYGLHGANWPRVIRTGWMNAQEDECNWISEFDIFPLAAQGAMDSSWWETSRDEKLFPGSPRRDHSNCNHLGQYTSLGIPLAVGMQGSLPPEIALLPALERLGLRGCNLTAELSHVIPSELAQLEALSRIDYANNNLHGRLPSYLWTLPNLTQLVLPYNQIASQVTSEIAMLSNLETLSLSHNRLVGTLPSEIGALSQIQSISLDANFLSGVLPSELGQMPFKSVSLSLNLLTGGIPTSIGQLTELESLVLNDNLLNNSLPAELGQLTSLSFLTLGSNFLTGTLSPSLFSSWQDISSLYLYDNRFQGSLPSQVGLMTNLELLLLHKNFFSGSLPSELGNLSQLNWLSCFDTMLEGPIPSDIGRLSALRQLELDISHISGPLPTQLGNLTSVVHLWLHNNAINGSIISEIGQMTALEVLALSDNQFSSSIPTEMGNLVSLKHLWLGGNPALSGAIPSEIGSLTELEDLRIQQTAINGTLPTELGKMTSLLLLYLRSSDLSGSLPSTMANLVSLQKLSLYGNPHLEGRIPTEFGLLTDLEVLSLRNTSISGEVPSELGLLTALAALELDQTALSGSIPSEICHLRMSPAFPLKDLKVDCLAVACSCDCTC